MKINDAEQILGITKANIRFYEKEGLLSPGRSEKGYREYTEADIARLKEIVIYRKLGIPVQQIADILDGAASLQTVLDEHIKQLNEEIQKLNGSLALCRQLKSENAVSLDTPRYWDILQSKERAGYQFQSLVTDYISFLAPTLEWLYFIPEDAWYSPKKLIKFLLLWSLFWAAANSFLKENFTVGNFVNEYLTQLLGYFPVILLWFIIFIPIYLISKKNPKLGKTLEVFVPVAILLLPVILIIWYITVNFIL